jgi:hypothetical protein
MRAAALAGAAVVLGACAQLPEVTPDTCGNMVVEGIEECDGTEGCGAADGANACFFVCDGAGEGCPDEGGYQCGADGRCRMPTERFVETGVEVAGAYGVSSVDMDGDGAADLLGYDSRGLLIRWGDGEGTLAQSTRVAIPFQLQPTQAPDVDGNGHRDLSLPIAEIGYGLFVADGGRGVVPAAQDSISLDFGDPCVEITAGSVRTDGSQTGQPQLLISIGGVILSFLEGNGCDSDPGLDCLLSAAGGPLVDGRFVTGRLGYGLFHGVSPDEQFAAAVVGADEVSVWGESSGIVLRPERLGTWQLAEPIAADGHVAFAHADGDGCLDYVVDTGTGGSLQVVYSQPVLGVCAGLATAVTTHERPPGTPIGIGDLDGDGVDEILTAVSFEDAGITYQVVVTYVPAPDRSGWALGAPVAQGGQDVPRAAVVLDYNHDGWNDLVMTYHDVDTVDFFLNYDGLGFSRFPVDVGGEPRTPVVGDFDGDLLDDIVITATDPTDPAGRDRTVVVYGESDGRPVGAQFLGDFVSEARPVLVQGGVQPTTDSVLVVSNDVDDPDACQRRLAVMIGDTSRQPVSPYIHLFPGSANMEPLFPTGVIDLSEPGVPRVLALGFASTAADGTASDIGLSVLEFSGTSYTSTGVYGTIPFTSLAPEAAIYAMWRAGDLDGDGVPEAVALVNGRAVQVRYGGGALDVEITQLPDELAGPQWFDLVDLDGDGDLDVLGAGGDPSSGGGVTDPVAPAGTLWVARNDGGLALDDPTVVGVPSSLYCVGAATIISNQTGLPQVVGVCYHESAGSVIAIGTFDPEASELASPRILPIAGDPFAVEVADFTGDGLEDIAVLGTQTVTLFRQCRADEVFFGSCTGLDPLP